MLITARAGKLYFATVLFGLFLLSFATWAGEIKTSWDAFTGRFIDSHFTAHPYLAVNAGVHEYDGRLPDWSREGIKSRIDELINLRRQAVAFDRKTLNDRQYLEKMHLLSVIDGELFWLEKARWPFRNPYFYAIDIDPNLYVGRKYAPAAKRLQAYISYAKALPRALDQIRGNLETPLAKPFIEIGVTLFEGLAQYMESDVPSAFEGAFGEPGIRESFENVNRPAIKNLRQLADWLKNQRVQSTEDFALGSGGFKSMLFATERLSIVPADIEHIVVGDLERNLDALVDVCRTFAPHRHLTQCIDRVKQDKPADVLGTARSHLGGLKKFVAEHDLVSIPGGAEPVVAESPPYRRWNPAYIDIPGPFEKTLPAVYYVAPPDASWSTSERRAYLLSRPELLFVSLHEVWPGHYLHFLHANRNPSRFSRLFVGYGFAEGWAHYTEEMMWEAGLNRDDPKTRIGQLLNALLRDVRCLAGIGLHTRGIGVHAAEKMFRDLAFLDEANARQQAARGTFDPEYVKYTLGKLMIMKLRVDWTKRNGGDKKWREFHDRLLSFGAPPLPLVRKIMLPSDTGSPL
ncbi:MAG: DUF885 domain-containing protein [Gammaproteobacteria bacterium]